MLSNKTSSSLDLISDHSKEKLQEVPKKVLEMTNLKMLFLEGNFLYKLPEDFFWKLPKLVWLDLRNNQLQCLPKSIAHHDYLENLLLTNNNLKTLPNELGLLPKLKALQVSENPLVYPPRKILVEGTKAIKSFLKEQYETQSHSATETEQQAEGHVSKKVKKEQQEELLNVQDLSSSDDSSILKLKQNKYKNRKNSKKELRNSTQIKAYDPYALQPTLNIKRISGNNDAKLYQMDKGDRKQNEPVKIIHKISRTGDTVCLTSSLNRPSARSDMNRAMESGLREGWLNQLRLLLSDQERILQQEKTLRALSEWQTKKRAETPKVFCDIGTNKAAVAPYATYPEYAKIPTRKELAAQLNTFFKEKRVCNTEVDKGHAINIDKLINDMMEQLKEMEQTYDVTRSPRSEIEEAERQIKTITNIHKKLLKLKSNNNAAII